MKTFIYVINLQSSRTMKTSFPLSFGYLHHLSKKDKMHWTHTEVCSDIEGLYVCTSLLESAQPFDLRLWTLLARCWLFWQWPQPPCWCTPLWPSLSCFTMSWSLWLSTRGRKSEALSVLRVLNPLLGRPLPLMETYHWRFTLARLLLLLPDDSGCSVEWWRDA